MIEIEQEIESLQIEARSLDSRINSFIYELNNKASSNEEIEEIEELEQWIYDSVEELRYIEDRLEHLEAELDR